jgi:hypothetical protein
MLRNQRTGAALFPALLAASLLRADTPDSAKTERQKIEALIAHIEELKGATFVRNGREYDAGAAAQFLRGKWQARASEIRTARDFVENVARASSTTGQPYLIRLRDGTEHKSGEYLLSRLQALEPRTSSPVVKPAAKKTAVNETDTAQPANKPADGGDSRAEPVEVTIRQRDTRAVPGLKDVQISIGDITEGRVTLSVTGAEEKILLEPVLVREGDVVDVAIGGKLYVVRVVELANALIGQDFATLSIAPAEAAQEDAARGAIRVMLRAAPETEFRRVQEIVASLSSLRITNLKQSAGKKGSGVSAGIRAGEATPSRRVAALVEALLDAGVDRVTIEVDKDAAAVPPKSN